MINKRNFRIKQQSKLFNSLVDVSALVHLQILAILQSSKVWENISSGSQIIYLE